MTLAFIESPIALIALFLIILICFGPQKVPEIANQIGRALGEFRRATSSFQQSMRVEDFDTSYKQTTNYDSYGNPTDTSASYTVPAEDLDHGSAIEAAPEPEVHHGDFASAAFSDDEFTYGISAPATPARSTSAATPAPEISVKPADSTVSRTS